MRAAPVFILGAVFCVSVAAENNCPAGLGTFKGGPCIPSRMVNYLFCVDSISKGRVEISVESADSKSNSLDVSAAGGGSGIVIKAQGSAGYKEADVENAFRKVTEKIDPTLAQNCKDMSTLVESVGTGGGNTAVTQRVKHVGPMGPLEAGISFNQGDIYDRPSRSAAECSSLCFNDDRCIAVTWIMSQQRCWVKGSFTGNTGRSGDMTSARKLIGQ